MAGYSILQKRWELQRTERKELRDVLDDAARCMAKSMRILDELWLTGSDPPEEVAETRLRLFAEQRSQVHEVRTANARIAIRAGTESRLYRTYDATVDQLNDYLRAIPLVDTIPQEWDRDKATQSRFELEQAWDSWLREATYVAGTSHPVLSRTDDDER